jgi:hypothetical protein
MTPSQSSHDNIFSPTRQVPFSIRSVTPILRMSIASRWSVNRCSRFLDSVYPIISSVPILSDSTSDLPLCSDRSLLLCSRFSPWIPHRYPLKGYTFLYLSHDTGYFGPSRQCYPHLSLTRIASELSVDNITLELHLLVMRCVHGVTPYCCSSICTYVSCVPINFHSCGSLLSSSSSQLHT